MSEVQITFACITVRQYVREYVRLHTSQDDLTNDEMTTTVLWVTGSKVKSVSAQYINVSFDPESSKFTG